jgi:hypothetical protein
MRKIVKLDTNTFNEKYLKLITHIMSYGYGPNKLCLHDFNVFVYKTFDHIFKSSTV